MSACENVAHVLGFACSTCAANDVANMSLDEVAALEHEIQRSLYVESFSRFFRAAWGILEQATPLKWAWPYEEVCRHLQCTIEDWATRQSDENAVQRIRNLLVTLPPGCLKSRLLAYLIPWAWLRWPHLRAIALSCNPRVALRDSMYSRDVIASEWYQRTFAPAWEVRIDSDAKGLYSNTLGGFRSAMGFDARIVGERGDVIIVDDPHDPEEANSDAQREHVHERWEASISNRVNDLGTSVRITIAQRTHEDDFSARRIAEKWTHLDLPMEFEPERACSTPLGKIDPRTIEGECLHAERFSAETIASEKAKGERRWATLYQGRPAPAGGALIKATWLRFWRDNHHAGAAASPRPKACWQGAAIPLPRTGYGANDAFAFSGVCIGADLAGGKKTERGDFNVITVVARAGLKFFLLEAWRARADFPEVQRKFRELHAKYPDAPIYVEQAAAGAPLVASLQAEIPGLIGVPTGNHGKVERVEAVLHYFEAGNVYLDENWTWLDGAVSELTTFPACRHDDFTDALTLALTHIGSAGGGVSAIGDDFFENFAGAMGIDPFWLAFGGGS